MQLKPLGIGVTVLCPGFVRTAISGSGRNRPERYGPARAPDPASAAGRLAAESARLQAGRARPGGDRRASAHRDPRGRTLRVHPSGDARRGEAAVCRHRGGDGQGGGALAARADLVRRSTPHIDCNTSLFHTGHRIDSVATGTCICSLYGCTLSQYTRRICLGEEREEALFLGGAHSRAGTSSRRLGQCAASASPHACQGQASRLVLCLQIQYQELSAMLRECREILPLRR